MHVRDERLDLIAEIAELKRVLFISRRDVTDKEALLVRKESRLKEIEAKGDSTCC